MKILLTNPPWLLDNRYGVRGGSRWPFTIELDREERRHYVPFPFFLAYSTSLLKKHGREVTIVDGVAEGLDVELFIDKVNQFSPDVLVFETSTPSFRNDVLIANRIKEALKNVSIVFCGPHASTFSSEILNKHSIVDYVLIGEYEYTLLELIRNLNRRLELKDVLGLAYRGNNEVRINKERPTIKSLDDLPWPEREGLPVYNYNDGFCGLPRPNVQILASRGCPYECVFCLWPQVMYREHLYRKRDPLNVICEMEWLLDRYDFKAVYFDDDIFNADRRYVERICKEIINRKINIPWAIMARPDLMDEELLECLVEAGIYAIKYGIESADDNILNLCKKNMDLGKIVRIIGYTKKLGIRVHLTFCLGLPGETRETIHKTLRFIERVKPDSLQFSLATPFPGTEYFNYVKDKNWLTSTGWSNFDANYRCVIRTQGLSNKDLEGIKVDIDSHYNS